MSQKPITNFEQRHYKYAFKVIRSLYDIPRTGWVDREVKDPETVGEHTDALTLLANMLYPKVHGLTQMLEIHDWPESDENVGDIRTDAYCPPSHRFTPEKKYELELAAMKKICSRLGQTGKRNLAYWLEFEEGKTRRAKIAKQLDKLQSILKAIEYQKQGQPVIAQEFIDHDGHKVQDPKLREIMLKAIAGL